MYVNDNYMKTLILHVMLVNHGEIKKKTNQCIYQRFNKAFKTLLENLLYFVPKNIYEL